MTLDGKAADHLSRTCSIPTETATNSRGSRICKLSWGGHLLTIRIVAFRNFVSAIYP